MPFRTAWAEVDGGSALAEVLDDIEPLACVCVDFATGRPGSGHARDRWQDHGVDHSFPHREPHPYDRATIDITVSMKSNIDSCP
jgi:hypothetical protein